MLGKITIQISWALALMTVSLSIAAQNKVVVIPLSVDETPTSKVVFVTESTWTGALGGPAGADQKCMDESLLSGSKVKGKKFKAWIGGDAFPSDFQVGTRSFNRSHLPYKTVNGTTVADDYADLMDGTLSAPINTSQSGSIVVTDVWTGIRTDGFDDYTDSSTCTGYTNGTSGGGIRGHSSSTGWHWTGGNSVPQVSTDVCYNLKALYCFEQ